MITGLRYPSGVELFAARSACSTRSVCKHIAKDSIGTPASHTHYGTLLTLFASCSMHLFATEGLGGGVFFHFMT